LDESYFGGKQKGKRGRGAAGKTIEDFEQHFDRNI
jgi:transposase-like protein